jgi:cycloeucalenol cycloisomerase
MSSESLLEQPLSGYWFSKNASKAWAEKFFLAYIPFFFAINASKQVFSWMDVGTFWHISQNILMLAPLYIIPLLIRDETNLGRKWYQTYWFKANLWIYIFAFVATYFFTEYFFDVLGMIYYFPQVTLYFDSALLGGGEQKVPLGMYFNGAAFFVVYHNLAVICLRRIKTSRINVGKIFWFVTVILTAVFFAWAETRLVATDENAPYFAYEDLAWMLKYGSLFYACYFVVSFPMFYRLDESPEDNWPLSKVCIDALAASMLVFFLLDLAMRVISR